MRNSSTKVKLNPRLYYEKQNESYNNEIETIIDDIFQTHRTDESEYIPVGNYIYEQIAVFAPTAEKGRAFEAYGQKAKAKIIDYSGEIEINYENLIANLMLYGKYPTYVIGGGMGTGKTAVCNYIVSSLIKHLDSLGNFIISIKFDFNGSPDESDEEILKLFKRVLYDELWLSIEDYLLDNPQALDDFCSILKDRKKRHDYSEFRQFSKYEQSDWIENIIPLETKIREFIKYVDSYEDKITITMKFIKFISTHKESNTVILVFDNIDILSPGCQRVILRNIFKYTTTANLEFGAPKVKCFVPLRRATFKRTLRQIEEDPYAKATYSFGYIHHHGLEPIRVVLERVKKVLQNFDNIQLLKDLSLEYKREIKGRMQLYKDFLETDNAFSKFFIAICGRSSRLGLSISKRFFANNIVEFNSHPKSYDLGIKSMIVGKNKDFMMDISKDSPILNIFCSNPYGDFSFTLYLILQYVNISKDILQNIELRYIYHKINSTFKSGISTEDFIAALNYILFVRRPLLWSDDLSRYSLNYNAENSLNTLQFTELGKGYIEMFKHNTQYLQECLLTINWNHDYIPQQFDSFRFEQRFSFLRKCILEILSHELHEIVYESEITPISIVLYICIGNSFASILQSGANDLIHNYKEEIYNWKSLRISLYNAFALDYAKNERITKFLESFNEND